jgi:5-methyltetrahydropteroyltriglutamate--homocysteine methyltransferase
MKLSKDRILVTHVGSLPRPAVLDDLLIRQEAGEAVDEALLAREAAAAVRDVVAKQIEAGIDIVNDGEQPRVGFQTYIVRRMSGFGGESKRPRAKDMQEFRVYARQLAQRLSRRPKVANAPQAVADVRYGTLDEAKAEAEMMHAALKAQETQPLETFMTAPSPGIIATTMLNAHYDSHEAYVMALARELVREYRFVVDQGFTLQIDAPDLAMERTMLFQDKSLAEFLAIVELHVAAINLALDDIPREKVRLHCCWGNWEGPHIHDVPLADILPLLYAAKAGALSLEFANPRHAHEYPAFKRHPLPSHMTLMAGVLDTTTNFVEHPELIANRLCEAAAAVGDRERVIASTDCGFGTFAGSAYVAEDVVWAKLAAARAGADVATKRLWG